MKFFKNTKKKNQNLSFLISKHLEKSDLYQIVDPIGELQNNNRTSLVIKRHLPLLKSYISFCRRKRKFSIREEGAQEGSILLYFQTRNQLNAIKPLKKELKKNKEPIVIFDNTMKRGANALTAAIRPRNVLSALKAYLAARKILKISRSSLKNKNNISDLYGLILWYNEFDALLNESIQTVVMSNDHSFCNRILLLVSLDKRKKTVYLQHGNVSKAFPKLNFHVALLDGQHAVETYEACVENAPSIGAHSISGRVEKIGNGRVSRSSRVVKTGLSSVGVLTNSAADPWKINLLVEKLSLNYDVKIRTHPAERSSKYAKCELNKGKNVRLLPGRSMSLEEFCNNCDIVLAGNTSAIVDCLLSGVAVIFVRDIDKLKDYYGYESLDLVPALSSKDMDCEVLARLFSKYEFNSRAIRKYSETFDTDIWGSEYKLAAKFLSSMN